MEDREKLIRQKILEKEAIEKMQVRGVKYIVYEILTKDKGFSPEDIQVEPSFRLALSTGEAKVGIDYMIALEGTGFAVILCVASGMEAWERYVVAFARAIMDYQIPFAIVTDGDQTKVFNILDSSSKLIPVEELFTREQAVQLMKNFQKIPCSEKTREKERRIIYAFEDIKCKPNKHEDD